MTGWQITELGLRAWAPMVSSIWSEVRHGL